MKISTGIFIACIGIAFVMAGRQVEGQTSNGWVKLGPNLGAVSVVVADQKHPGTLLAAATSGQIFKTTDDGQNWNPLSLVRDGYIYSMIIDTSDPNRVYVGTNRTIYASTDGGKTLVPYHLPAHANALDNTIAPVIDIQINPYNNSTLEAITNYALYESINYGQSWGTYLSAPDTSLITAFAFSPTDPSNKYLGLKNVYTSSINNNIGQSQIGNRILIVPSVWMFPKIFIANDSFNSVHAIQGIRAGSSPGFPDSTKIIYATNPNFQGPGFTTGYCFTSYAQQGNIPDWNQYIGTNYTWHVQKKNTYIVSGLKNGPFKTNTGGIDTSKTNHGGSPWYTVSNNQNSSSIISLELSPVDTSEFYGISDVGVKKFILSYVLNQFTPYRFAQIQITNGLSAISLDNVNYVDLDNIIVTFNIAGHGTGMALSQNRGADWAGGKDATKPVTAYKSHQSGLFYWIESDSASLYQTINGNDNKVFTSHPPFTYGTDSTTDAFSFPKTFLGDSTIVLASTAKRLNQPGGHLWMSINDGVSWSDLYTSDFNSQGLRRVTGYRDNFDQLTKFVAATDHFVFYQSRGQSSWNKIFSTSANYYVQHLSASQGTAVVHYTFNGYYGGGYDSLAVGFLDRISGIWNFQDITPSLNPLYQANGAGYIQNITTADDGIYVILQHFAGTTRVYKTGYSKNIRWVEITDPETNIYNFTATKGNYDSKDQAYDVYASSINGLWKLKQTPILSQDTSASAQPTGAVTGNSSIVVNYHNDGTAFAYMDSFKISGDPLHNFSIADSHLVNPGHSINFGLDIKTTTGIAVKFTPKTVGPKQATLNAYYRSKASNGTSDSTIIFQTKLYGSAIASRISSSLKGDTLDFKGALLNSTESNSFFIANTGNDILHVSNVFLQSGSNFKLSNIGVTDSSQFDIAPGNAVSVTLSFTPDSNRQYSDNLVIQSSAYNYSNNTNDSVHIVKIIGRGSAIGIDTANVIAKLNNDLSLDVTFNGLSASDVSGFVKYRPTGTGSGGYTQRNLSPKFGTGGNAAVLNVTIPSDEITSDGLEFYIQATSGGTTLQFPDNGESKPYALSISIPSSPGLNSSSTLTLPGGTSSSAYRMVSFPIDLSQKNPQGAFSSSNMGVLDDKGDWELYRYDNTGNQFLKASDPGVSFGTIKSGQSYLLITRKPKILNSGPGKSVTPDQAFVQVNPGWNMIADPYTFSVNWFKVANLNNKVDETNIVVLDNGQFRYVDEADLFTLNLEPWKGYFYYSPPDSGTFFLRYPPINADVQKKSSENPKSRLITKDNLGEKEYFVSLKLKSKQNDSYSSYRFGELKDAQRGLDGFDKRPLPVLNGDEVQLRFVSEDKIYLNSEFKPISENGNYWDFEIAAGNGKAKTELTWTGYETLPANYELKLMDRDHNTMINLKTTDHLAMDMSGKEARHFRLFAGTNSFIESNKLLMVPTSFYLSQNYPNPFNPTTTIRYGLSQSGRVQLVIYNALGQKVRALVNADQTAASYNVVWDGRNDLGGVVASGMYFYRLEIQNVNTKKVFTQTHKMILLK